jgi:hypothetical protein
MNNNQLVHKYQYYLNESHRLNEELKSEVEYSEILESLLFELLDEEDINSLFEDVQTPERRRQMRKRIKGLTAKADATNQAAIKASTAWSDTGDIKDYHKANAAHDAAANAAALEIAAIDRDRTERGNPRLLYGKNGVIVGRRRAISPARTIVKRIPTKWGEFEKP